MHSISKSFRLPKEQVHTLKERVIHPFRRPGSERLDALREVSFDVASGEFFGIVGRNGSGKSTLLKCLAGIYRADGEILLRGRMAPFIELGVGFNPDMTARENVVINAVMLGLTPAQARARYDAIIEFAELEEFTELKLKNYSSGMQVRLAFAVMVQVDADILLIDEVLAVGDASFQQKCHDTLNRMRVNGRTILYVTHDMHAVQRVCDRAMLLEKGRLDMIGEPEEVARRYNEINFLGDYDVPADESGRSGDGAVLILESWAEDAKGARATTFTQGEECRLKLKLEAQHDVEDPVATVSVRDDHRRTVFVATTDRSGQALGELTGGQVLEIGVRFKNVLAPGRYFVTPSVAYPRGGSKLMDSRRDLGTFVVTGTRSGGGIVDLPHDIEVGPMTAPAGTPAG